MPKVILLTIAKEKIKPIACQLVSVSKLVGSSISQSVGPSSASQSVSQSVRQSVFIFESILAILRPVFALVRITPWKIKLVFCVCYFMGHAYSFTTAINHYCGSWVYEIENNLAHYNHNYQPNKKKTLYT